MSVSALHNKNLEPELAKNGKAPNFHQLSLFFGKGLILIGPGEHFGLHLAKRFGQEGFEIALLGRSEDKLVTMVKVLQKSNIRSFPVCTDVSDIQQLQNAFTEIQHRMVSPQCLIYNVKAAIRDSGLIEISPDQLTQSLAANISGAVCAIQLALPILKNAENPTIILTGGGYGYQGKYHVNKLALSISKAGIDVVCRSWKRKLLTDYGIKLRTVIIDGAVREEGPLRSADVAEQFWQVFSTSPRKYYVNYSETEQKKLDMQRTYKQLSLFANF